MGSQGGFLGSLPNRSEDLGSLLWNRGVPEGTEGRWEGFGAAGVSGGGGIWRGGGLGGLKGEV